MSLKEVVRAYEAFLLGFPNVVGVGSGTREMVPRGYREDCVKVYVTQKAPLQSLGTGEVLPKWIEGYPVVVEEVGVIEALERGDVAP